MHMQNVKERGVLISGVASDSNQSGKPLSGVPTQYFIVSGSAGKVCPSLLPARVALTVEPLCCDVMPAKEGCIAPFPKAIFKILGDGT